jgi:hypothetical protein
MPCFALLCFALLCLPRLGVRLEAADIAGAHCQEP